MVNQGRNFSWNETNERLHYNNENCNYNFAAQVQLLRYLITWHWAKWSHWKKDAILDSLSFSIKPSDVWLLSHWSCRREQIQEAMTIEVRTCLVFNTKGIKIHYLAEIGGHMDIFKLTTPASFSFIFVFSNKHYNF